MNDIPNQEDVMRKVSRLVLHFIAMFILTLSCGKDSKKSGSPVPPPHKYKNISFVTIPGGSFRMGDFQNYNQYSNEKPVHDVTISSFEMSMYEVTNAQYASFLTEA